VQAFQHVSEITPWLKRTEFHAHLAGVEKDDLPSSYQVPKAGEDQSLNLVCQSVNRVLQDGMDKLSNRSTGAQLHRIDRQQLNSFQANVTQQDPLDRLQDTRSFTAYSLTWQKAVCFYFRVENDHFSDHRIFSATEVQRRTAVALLDEAMSQTREKKELSSILETSSDQADTSDDDIQAPNVVRRRRQQQETERQQQNNERLNKLALAFCLALIQHPITDTTFNSPLLSFYAVLA